jgi:outer membrane protein TolC
MRGTFLRSIFIITGVSFYSVAGEFEHGLICFSDTPMVSTQSKNHLEINSTKKSQVPTTKSLPLIEKPSKKEDTKVVVAKESIPKKKRKISKQTVKPLQKTTAKSTKTSPLTQSNTTQSFTLKKAILTALKKSYKISAAREKVIQAKRKLDEKLAYYKPTLNLSANAGGAYLSPYHAEEVKFLKSDESLTLNQNIYAGGKHSGEIKRERANLRVAQEKFKDKVEEEAIKVIDAYLSLIYQKMGIEINRANMKSLEKILQIVSDKEAAGAASKGDLNYIKSQVENASSALVKAESKYQNAIAFYEYYVGTLDRDNTPSEYEFLFTLEDENSTLKKMYQHNAKLQVALAKMEAEEYNLKAQKSKFKPTLDLSITAKDKQSGYEAEPQEDRVTGLLSFNYNLYNGGKDKAILLGTKSKIAELRYKLIDLKEGSEYNTKQMYENILSSLDALKHTQNEVDANIKVVDSYWAAFKYGTQDIQALLLAQRALNRSQLDVIKEKQAYTNGYFKLMQQTGTLLEHLGLKDFIDAKKILQDKELNYFR